VFLGRKQSSSEVEKFMSPCGSVSDLLISSHFPTQDMAASAYFHLNVNFNYLAAIVLSLSLSPPPLSLAFLRCFDPSAQQLTPVKIQVQMQTKKFDNVLGAVITIFKQLTGMKKTKIIVTMGHIFYKGTKS
jgi:hypothetical protein